MTGNLGNSSKVEGALVKSRYTAAGRHLGRDGGTRDRPFQRKTKQLTNTCSGKYLVVTRPRDVR